MSLFYLFVARGGRKRGNRQTDRRTDGQTNIRIKERRAYRDSVKRKGDKIGMVSVVSSKMRMVSEEL